MENQKQVPWHSSNKKEVLGVLDTSEEGLSCAEAAKRLKEYGFNELRQKPKKSLTKMLLEQILDPMVLILIGASTLSLFLDQLVEGFAILGIVVLNAVIGIIQEKKAESSIEALKSMSAPVARVIRDGEENIIPAKELVVGDIVVIEAGSMVPADIRLIESSNLKVQEASLTGESIASEKDADDIVSKECVLGDRTNMAYTSSIVTYGRALGVVVSTGMNTEIGNIANMIENCEDFDTPLKRKLNAVGKSLTVIGIIVCIVIFSVGALYGRPLVPMFMVAIALAISIIPEGLPATATIVMALGVQRMAKKNALMRNLPAVETLGNATVICTDKTGTLTLNKMTVTDIAVSNDFKNKSTKGIKEASKYFDLYRELVYASALCNDASLDPDRKGEIIGDPTEGALIYMAQEFNINHEELEDKYPRVFEQPFDSDRKRMTTVHEIDGNIVAYVKGAVDEMIPLCNKILTDTGVRDITDKDKQGIRELCLSMSEEALRVLGFAMKYLDKVPVDDDENVESDLIFIGAVGMIDPPREEVAESVRVCHEAGIRTIMITGDHKVTALAIAKKLGIWNEGDTIVTGDELDNISDYILDEKVKTTTVFSRVSPSDKLRIIEALKRNNEVVAMTGDGVNDSPALKAADIGVAMGITGCDVAKDSADMILLDDSFTTIEYSIKEGRRIYRNIQKVIQFLLIGNIAEIATLFIGTLFNWEAPLLGIHILWVNLATATLPALALGVDPPSKNIMKHKPVKSGTLFEKELIVRVVTQGIFTSLMTLTAYWIGLKMHSLEVGQTMAFAVLAFSQMVRSLNQHSNTESILNRNNSHNKWLGLSFGISLILMITILYLPSAQVVFNVESISLVQWMVIIILVLITVIQVEIVKFIKRLNKKKSSMSTNLDLSSRNIKMDINKNKSLKVNNTRVYDK